MIDDIVEQYVKHGWTLRRILLADKKHRAASLSLLDRFPGATIFEADFDAMWFSRASRDAETWELRRLSGAPFALLDVLTPEVSDAERRKRLENIEDRMAETIKKIGP